MASPETTTEAASLDRTRSFFDGLTIACFLFALLAPTLDLFVRSEEKRAPTLELRKAGPMPKPPDCLADVLEYPRKFEAHWNDSFGLRDKLLRWHSIFKVFGLGVAPSRKHLIGKDGWIFIRADSNLESWRGSIPFSTAQLEWWRRRLEARAQQCEKMGAHYLFVIGPDKPEIYPEFLPDSLRSLGPSRADQLFAWLREHSQVDALDLRPCLIDEKKNDVPAKGDYVYYPLGAHWQTRGAIRAANEILAHVESRFRRVVKTPLARHVLNSRPPGGDTEARNMYIKDLLAQSEYWWTPAIIREREVERSGIGGSKRPVDGTGRVRITTVADKALPRGVMLHDSFAPYLEQTFAESFSRLAMFWQYDFEPERIAAEKPELVIEMVVERALVFQTNRP